MRVIAGYLGGRQFNSPRGKRTHPMSDKVRGGLFNALGDIEGLTILDIFAGSGALAIEAISRHAGSAVTIESDRNAHESILQNTAELGIKHKVKSTQAYFGRWSVRNKDKVFDLVFADPPYDDLQKKDLLRIPQHLKAGGILSLSYPGDSDPLDIPGLSIMQTKQYGDAQLVFYKKVS